MSERFRTEIPEKTDVPRAETIPPPSAPRAIREMMHQDPELYEIGLQRVRKAIQEIQQHQSDQCPNCFPLRDDELRLLVNTIQDLDLMNAIEGKLSVTVLSQLKRLAAQRERAK